MRAARVLDDAEIAAALRTAQNAIVLAREYAGRWDKQGELLEVLDGIDLVSLAEALEMRSALARAKGEQP